MTSYQKTLLTTALDLVRAGYYVFPLTVVLDEATSKKRLSMPFPHAEGWNHHSSNSEEQVREWFAMPRKSMKGLAIDCGKSGVVAVDLDVSGSVNGLESWNALPEQQPTPMTVVTRSGGVHRFYRDPSGRIRNSAGEVGPGIDIRGVGGLVITAPTRVFGSDGVYSFGNGITPVAELPELTEGMIEVITARQETARPRFDPSIHGTYKVSEEQGREILRHRLERLGTGRGMRAAIFGYAVGYAQFEGGKAARDEATLDADSVADAIGRQILDVVPWEALDDEDMAWIADGVSKGLAQPWEIVTNSEVLPDVEEDVPLDELLQRVAPRMPGSPSKSHALAAPVVVDELEGRYLHVDGLGWHEWVGDRWSPEPNIPVRNAVQRMILRHRAEANRMQKALASNEEYAALRSELQVLQESGSAGSQRALEVQKRVDDAAAWADDWKANGSWWYALGNGRDFEQVMRFVEADPGRIYIRAENLDKDPNLLNCTNGTVDLRTGAIRRHDPKDYITKTTKVPFDPSATHPLWDKAREAFAPRIEEWLQKKVGEGAFGRPSNDDTMLFSFGGGSNGKSTLTDAILYSLGDYVVFLHDKAVLGSDGDHSTEKMVFRGARWAVLEELPEAQVLRPAILKKLIGTAKITARLMRQNNVTFDATHSLLINSNHRPQVLENDRGTWRRLVAVPWPYTFKFPGEALEDSDERWADTKVKHGLKTDVEVQKAALAWIVAGAVAFTDAGDTCGPLPELVQKETGSWRMESDTFGAFFDAELVVDRQAAVSSAELLSTYNEWLEDLGKKPVSDGHVGTRLSTIKGAKAVTNRRIKRNTKSLTVSTQGVLTSLPDQFRAWTGLRWKTAEEKAAALAE
ncbi:phage/plasmid primase, P4 family, C-terminal domain-containing protein [Saccharopolyspora kobensis]|uniref:Phage/plasmid primase, P4 family, C-terminal domain-containing protein n=1 Tax=Saccharopolyspora kobensis TaxID=146035 RepID=A0A1H6ELG0_9PSEU|nr:phage/plasmid primase, P4 family [Saccharopolyspora kobensis]SEG98688.1 phage/plasmid primase, P4 family, C-terminal domain-containing protein [Saccharopolyspora kobensis]SFD23814.1 phage/plasmid primase, P4 family, C-terminal domain-containing protein [Saccharopolyspora kobensis]